MTMALEGGEGSASCPSRSLPPGRTRYSLYRRLGGPRGRSGQVQKISPPPGFDPRTVQPVASCFTDYATWPTVKIKKNKPCVYSVEHNNVIHSVSGNKFPSFWPSAGQSYATKWPKLVATNGLNNIVVFDSVHIYFVLVFNSAPHNGMSSTKITFCYCSKTRQSRFVPLTAVGTLHMLSLHLGVLNFLSNVRVFHKLWVVLLLWVPSVVQFGWCCCYGYRQ
jgi:hypothetical protein